MRRLHPSTAFILSLASAMTWCACTAEEVGPDSDGDGLSDAQEAHFCTDPFLADTDGDTIPDSKDPDPCTPPRIILACSTSPSVTTQERACMYIQYSVRDALGRYLDALSIASTTTLGTLAPPESLSTGIYRTELCSDTDGLAVVTLQTVDASGNPDGKASESISVELKKKTPPEDDNPGGNDNPGGEDLFDGEEFVLEVPGLNPGRYAEAGTLAGDIWIMAIDGESLDWSGSTLAPYKDAFIQIDFPDGTTLTGNTNEKGWIHLTDPRLHGPVTITVGAQDARYITWVDTDARVVSAGIHGRDITRAEADTKGAKITGLVRGFWGETGLPSFPTSNTNVFGTINIAIVQVATRNYPLSSMNTGSILLPPDASSATAAYFEIPPNLVLCNLNDPDMSRFTLDMLKPGKYVVFALAGAGANIMAASQNPYIMKFEPMALGMKEVEVKAGETSDIVLDLSVDLRQADKAPIHFGQLPDDPQTGTALPMGLILPLINTGRGYIFLDVNTAYNFEGFTNPSRMLYPDALDATLTRLGLGMHPMAVGLAARKAVSGYDRPGISTAIAHPGDEASGIYETTYMNDASRWLPLPGFVTPAPPQSDAFDAVGGNLYPSRQISWTQPDSADMAILRFNYMTPPIHNKILNSDIGASQAHPLWEIYVPAPKTSITLPRLPASAPDYPVLVNHAPTVPGDAYQYAADTVELEINAYKMGPRPFDYHANFLIDDVNMNSMAVSQDSYLISVKP